MGPIPAADFRVYALLTAVFFGLGPILSKRGLAVGGTWMGNTLLMVGSRVGIFWVVLLVTGEATTLLNGLGPLGVVAFGLAGILGSGIGRILFYIGVDRVGSSLAAAFANTRPLFAVLLALVWLDEVVTLPMAAGVVVLVLGLAILSISRGGDVTGWRRVDLAFPLAAALVFALGNVIRRFGLTATPATVIQGIAVGESAALVAVVGYAVASGRTEVVRAPREAVGLFLTTGVLASLGLFTLFEALDRGPVSVVDPLVATSPLFTVVLAAVLLRRTEQITTRLAIGVVLVVVGVGLVTAI